MAPFTPGGAEKPRILLRIRPNALFYPCSPQILLWPGDGNQNGYPSVRVLWYVLVVAVEVPTLDDHHRRVLAMSVGSGTRYESDGIDETRQTRDSFPPAFSLSGHQPSRPRCLAATQCYAACWPASQSCPLVPLGSHSTHTKVPPCVPSQIHP
ncbi:hypothetical protein B0T20DRAFT_449945 [Sordaria brevicollis]|uniref:Uncharacterized protein n=1 Tax=Sordaria brevicollis TaxID=83679 RepID=A0AAE0PNA6_SORBR|nr:hypothetical protein B0T20DRAFT_449945 [Sordaria brevicollis]